MRYIWIAQLPEEVQEEIRRDATKILKTVFPEYNDEKISSLISDVMREKIINVVGDSENELSIEKYGKYIFQ